MPKRPIKRTTIRSINAINFHTRPQTSSLHSAKHVFDYCAARRNYSLTHINFLYNLLCCRRGARRCTLPVQAIAPVSPCIFSALELRSISSIMWLLYIYSHDFYEYLPFYTRLQHCFDHFFSARCNIYISRLCYDVSVVYPSVCDGSALAHYS